MNDLSSACSALKLCKNEICIQLNLINSLNLKKYLNWHYVCIRLSVQNLRLLAAALSDLHQPCKQLN